MKVLTRHLNGQPDQLAEAKEAVISLVGQPGWHVLTKAIEQRKLDLMKQLTNRQPSESGADYERIIGEIRGLDQVSAIVEGIVRAGRKAERQLRDKLEND